VIFGGNRGIQGSESEIEVARTWKNQIAKEPSEGWVQRAGGASVVEEERAMMEDDWQITNVNNTILGACPSAINLAGERVK
jgi:hypothetical protein